MNQHGPSGAQPAPTWQCSNPACQASFAAPVQQCLTCGALLTTTLLSERFRIEALLGRGGMGAVYRASDLALGRQVAVKVLAPSAGLAGDAPQELRARFFREARVAAQLDHPNIVPVLHFDIDGPLAYLVMPLLVGGTLAQRVRPRQPADPALVAGWLRQIAAALDFAHQRPQPIVHRDVKPSNLLFHEDGRLCLADFGIARVVAGSESRESAQITRAGVVMGSLSYMAPEQINGRAVPASDQYSTGVLLYELLTGALPFDAADQYGLIIQHVSATPPLPSEHAPGLPPGGDAVVMRALAKHPEDRFPTVTALAEAFEQALSGAPSARLAGEATPRATLPVAPRPTFPLADVRPEASSLIDDPRGDLPTQAATRLRPPPGWPPAFHGTQVMAPGAPPLQQPSAPPRRHRRWVIALAGGLLALCLCVAALGALSKLGQIPKMTTSATATTSRPSPTAALDPHLALLRATERNKSLFHDGLTSGHDWQRNGAARFASDGLHLPSGGNAGGNAQDDTKQTSAAFHEKLRLSDCDLEVDLRFTGASVTYGFLFLPLAQINHALGLSSDGSYQVSTVIRAGKNFNNTDPRSGSDLRLQLFPDMTYHLAVLIQGDQLSLFLGSQQQTLQYILTITYTPAFNGSGVLALANFTGNGQPNDLTFSNLIIYPLS